MNTFLKSIIYENILSQYVVLSRNQVRRVKEINKNGFCSEVPKINIRDKRRNAIDITSYKYVFLLITLFMLHKSNKIIFFCI